MPRESQLVPGERWTFDDDVTAVFDDMLARSIPDYEGMRQTVFDIGSKFVRPKTAIVDLGASRGEAHAPFMKRFGATCHHVLCEVSPPMLEALRQRYVGEWVNAPPGVRPIVAIESMDLRYEYPKVQSSLTLAILTLQFIPIEYRSTILRRIYDSTVPGGAAIIVEKVLGQNATSHNTLVNTYHELKVRNGYTREEVDRKALALEGVLVPVTAKHNVDLIRDAGFRTVEGIWRRLNFAGWLAVKE